MTNGPAPIMHQPGSFSLATQLLAFFAGIAGGLAFVQLYNGGILWVLLAYLSALPLFLSGLTGGRAAAITACVFALLAVFLRTSIESTIFFAAVIAIPTVVITRVALINYSTDPEQSRFTSGGTILLTVMTLGTILMVVAAALLELYGTGISAAVQSVLGNYQTVLAQTNPELPGDQIKQLLEIVKSMMPALVLMSWFMIITFNGILAQWFAAEIKQNVRPTPMLRHLELPLWMVGIFGICMVGSWMTGIDTSMVFTALGTLYAVGFVVSGLGVMHRWIDTRAVSHNWSDSKKLGLYIAAYAALFILQVPVFFLLLFGLIAPFTAWRHHQRTVTPDQTV